MIEAAEKCPDARRVAPIRACVSCQIDRLKSGFEAMGRTVIPGICALMGAFYVIDQIFGKFFLLKDLLDTDVSIQLLS